MFTDVIKNCPLFAGVPEHDISAMLDCLSAVRRVYNRDEFIFHADEEAASVGVVISGGVLIIQEDYWGSRAILAHIGPGGLFGEAFSCAETQRLPVSVIAAERSEIMMIDYRKIVTVCTSACSFHTKLITNMLRVIAEKNILLTRKMEHLSKRTTREKLLSYLSAEAVSAKSGVVEVPFNRQELSDYLCVDRSALSREMGLMQREGLLRYDKNKFELLR